MSAQRTSIRLSKAWRRAVFSASVASLLALASCAKLIGIEDVSLDPAFAGSAGTTGGGSNAGSGAVGGHANSSGGNLDSVGGRPHSTAGQANSAGGATAGTDEVGDTAGSGGTEAQGGTGNLGGGSAVAGSSGAAGAGSTVHGHVIDFWGHQLSNVSVEVGGKTSTTDAQGAFSFDAIASEYDASLVVSYNVNGRIKTRAWVYQGLTRRDPTLQIYEGLSDRGTQIDVLPNNPPTLTASRTLSIAFGGPDGSAHRSDVSGPGLAASHLAWQGPQVTHEVADALIWEPDSSSGFPTQYLASDSKEITLTDTADGIQAHGTVSFDLSADTITAGTIAGTVPGSGFTARFNNVFMRYSSNGVIKLLADEPKSGGFSYVVPSIANASATLVVGEGNLYLELGVAHKGGLLPNTSGISLNIPTPARDLTVTPSTDLTKVSATTQFSFKPGGSAGAPFVSIFAYEDNSVHDDILYLVSAKPTFSLPKVVNGSYTLPPGGPYVWRIETHGSPASVDAMAGPNGFLDAVSNSDFCDEPSGPSTADGSYTLSRPTELQLAP